MSHMNDIVIIIIIILLIIVLFIPLLTRRRKKIRRKLEWKNNKPIQRYRDLVDEFGNPNILNKSMAIWNKDVGPYNEIILKDEEIPHCCPKPHYDFLYSSISVKMNPLQKLVILAISKSVWYDELKQELWARCHFMGANVATLVLATRILDLSPEDLDALIINSLSDASMLELSRFSTQTADPQPTDPQPTDPQPADPQPADPQPKSLQDLYKKLIMSTMANPDQNRTEEKAMQNYESLTDELISNLASLHGNKIPGPVGCELDENGNPIVDCKNLFTTYIKNLDIEEEQVQVEE